MSINENKTVWIGLVNLVPNEGNSELGDAKGAYVNILAYVENKEHYINLVKFAVYEHNYTVSDIEDIDTFEHRVNNFEVSDDLKELAQKVLETKKTHFGEFFVYGDEN